MYQYGTMDQRIPCLKGTPIRAGVLILRPGKTYTLGREAACDVILPHPKCSRIHAIIRVQENGRMFLEDNDSVNGTFLNGQKILRPSVLADSDKITIGIFEFSLVGLFPHEIGAQGALEEETWLDHPYSASTTEVKFKGSFEGNELHELCQLLELNEKTGRLKIEAKGFGGELVFEKGLISGARLGARTGKLAVENILEFTLGVYEFIDQRVTPGRMAIRPTSIIMSILSRRDEAQKGLDVHLYDTEN